MIRICAILVGLSLASSTPAGEPRLEPARTHALVVGVLEWPGRGLGSFSKRGRLDRALQAALVSRGTPDENVIVLLDEQASLANIRKALDASLARVGPGDTFLFYYAGHGLLRPGGQVYFANYDIDPSAAKNTGLALTWLAERLARGFKGERILLAADCCYSGALARVVRSLQRAGIRAASLTSADASNYSTGNWTFSLTLLGCLLGDSLADRDGDGSVRLGEARVEVAEVMKHVEHQRAGYANGGVPEELVLSACKAPGEDRPAELGRFVRSALDGNPKPARITGRSGERVELRFYAYNRTITRTILRQNLSPISYPHHPVGAEVGVLWGKQVYPARILKVDGDFHWITYPGWDAYWNEWVMADRIVAGDKKGGPELVEIEWHGRWYPGVVLKADGPRYRVHYIGYDDSWDEWVPKARIRPR